MDPGSLHIHLDSLCFPSSRVLLLIFFAIQARTDGSESLDSETCITEQHISDYDHDVIAEDYANMKNKNPHFKNDRFTLENIVGEPKKISLIDLACGDGFYARHFKKMGAHRVVGVDVSVDMVALGEASESYQPLGIRYYHGNCKSLQYIVGLGKFDVALASYLLNYLSQSDMVSTFKGIYNILSTGGRFVGLTINPSSKLPDYPAEWFQKYGIQCNRYYRNSTISCDIDKMDGSNESIHLETFYHEASIYEHAAHAAGFAKFEWVPINKHPDNVMWEKEYFDWHIAIGYVATK